MNRKALMNIQIAFLGILLAQLVATVALTDSHRERKAIKMCVAEGQGQSACEDKVSNMSKEEILAYVKTDDQQVYGNGGNFSGGYMK